MKDIFSTQSDQYAKYRPTYPDELFDFLNSIVVNKKYAWDCGTGNGQVAYELAKTFENVLATDISKSQIDHAIQASNIAYSVQPAENTNFPSHHFDLITVAQAIHWFDFEKFYSEVRRTAKNNAVIAVIGYDRIQVSPDIDSVITDFYINTIGSYWDKERKYIDEHYATIPFPFEEIKTPYFVNEVQWTIEHLIGYLNTWSAVKHFSNQNQRNPVSDIRHSIEQYWGGKEIRDIKFPVLLRIGKVNILK